MVAWKYSVVAFGGQFVSLHNIKQTNQTVREHVVSLYAMGWYHHNHNASGKLEMFSGVFVLTITRKIHLGSRSWVEKRFDHIS